MCITPSYPLRASSALNAISGNAITTKIAPFLVDKDTRAEAEKFNSEFTKEALNNPNLLYSPEQWGKYQSSADLLVSFNGITSFPTTLLRYRIDTEHGQSLNVFESCIYKSDLYASPDRETLYIIALHGQGSYASKQHILRVTEARQLLQAENAINNIVVVTPDYSGSVASGGVCRSMAELAQNTVLKTVDHLIARGVDPSQIIVRGFSLGGMVATVGAAMCCRKGKEVSLINIDSFANAGKWLGNKEDLAATAVLAQWNTKADEYFDEIPEDRRYCIAKAADKMMWKTEEHQNRSLYHQLTQKHPELVNTKHLQLIDIQNFDHNDDVILMGKNNPCLAIYRETHARLLNSPLHNNDHDDSEDRPHSFTTR